VSGCSSAQNLSGATPAHASRPGGSRWASHEITSEPGPVAHCSTARKKRSARSCRRSSTAAPIQATTSRLGRMMSLMTMISLTFRCVAFACAQVHLVNPKTVIGRSRCDRKNFSVIMSLHNLSPFICSLQVMWARAEINPIGNSVWRDYKT
jgi:hypothetical protein